MLLLHVLSCKGDCYGYQLSQLIKKSSGGELDFSVGSLYPALYKMIDHGYISDYKQQCRQTPSAGFTTIWKTPVGSGRKTSARILCHLSQHSAGFKQ